MSSGNASVVELQTLPVLNFAGRVVKDEGA